MFEESRPQDWLHKPHEAARDHRPSAPRFDSIGSAQPVRREPVEPRLLLAGDTIGMATPLGLVEDPVGFGYLLARGSDAIDPAGEVDYWSFIALAGDKISVSVDTPDSGLNPYIRLRNSSDGDLPTDAAGRRSYDDNAGPGSDAFVSQYTIASSGTVYVRVDSQSSTTGSYELHVDLVRGQTQLEYDSEYANDAVSGANVLIKSLAGADTAQARVAGTVMAPPGVQFR